ncbi:MAG: hypothetical protein CMN93_08120 [Synechococcus sp. CPC35]|nr:hypothetical protein [Synechococcus sp. CPC35]
MGFLSRDDARGWECVCAEGEFRAEGQRDAVGRCCAEDRGGVEWLLDIAGQTASFAPKDREVEVGVNVAWECESKG